MYKVFFNDKIFYVSNNLDSYDFSNVSDFMLCLKKDKLKKKKYNIMSQSFDFFSSHFHKIDAAGGLVVNNDKFLFIYKNNKWDLPKGKIEEKENSEKAALREVSEETGLVNIRLKKFLTKTFHIYFDKAWFLKTTFWFLMDTEDIDLSPQKNEGITNAQWFYKSEIEQVVKNSYLNIRCVVGDFSRR